MRRAATPTKTKVRSLELDDIRHYCRVVTAISRTIEIQREIDSFYGESENSVIEFRNGGRCV